MTGIYCRVERNGLPLNIELEHMTDEERERVITNPMRWLNTVCRIISGMEEPLKKG